MIMADQSNLVYEIYFDNLEGSKQLHYVMAASKEDAKDKFLSQKQDFLHIFYVLPFCVNIYED